MRNPSLYSTGCGERIAYPDGGLAASSAHNGLSISGDTYLPHVANISRNVIVRSANAAGTRGHTAFSGQGKVDIEYVRFEDLGRTTNHAWRMDLLDFLAIAA